MRNKLKIIIVGLLLQTTCAYSQVGINTTSPHPSTILHIESNNKGILINKVQLTSRKDITTIPNPATGLLVINKADAGTGSKKVYKDILYHFNGEEWEELLLNNTNYNNFLFPKVAAIGRKTTETSCTDLTSKTFELDPTTFILRDGNILYANGSIKAARSGYYSWSVQLVQKMKKDAYSPYFDPGFITYAFRTGTTTVESDQYFTYSGSVYLSENSTSTPFTWSLGDLPTQKCSTTDKIGKQLVVWRYLGE